MSKVRVEPLGVEFELLADESVMEAAERSGYYWPTVCGGMAQCGACRCEVLSGGQHASAPDDAELRMLREISGQIGGERLACRLKFKERGVVFKDGVHAW